MYHACLCMYCLLSYCHHLLICISCVARYFVCVSYISSSFQSLLVHSPCMLVWVAPDHLPVEFIIKPVILELSSSVSAFPQYPVTICNAVEIKAIMAHTKVLRVDSTFIVVFVLFCFFMIHLPLMSTHAHPMWLSYVSEHVKYLFSSSSVCHV